MMELLFQCVTCPSKDHLKRMAQEFELIITRNHTFQLHSYGVASVCPLVSKLRFEKSWKSSWVHTLYFFTKNLSGSLGFVFGWCKKVENDCHVKVMFQLRVINYNCNSFYYFSCINIPSKELIIIFPLYFCIIYTCGVMLSVQSYEDVS